MHGEERAHTSSSVNLTDYSKVDAQDSWYKFVSFHLAESLGVDSEERANALHGLDREFHVGAVPCGKGMRLSDTIYLYISFRKSTSTQNRRLNISIGVSKPCGKRKCEQVTGVPRLSETPNFMFGLCPAGRECVERLQGYLAHKKQPPP